MCRCPGTCIHTLCALQNVGPSAASRGGGVCASETRPKGRGRYPPSHHLAPTLSPPHQPSGSATMTHLFLALLLATAAAASLDQLKQAVLDSPLRTALASHPPPDPASACYTAAVASLHPNRCVDDLRQAAHGVRAMRLLSCYAQETGEADALPPCVAKVAADAAKAERSGGDATDIDVASCHARLSDRHASAYSKLWLHAGTLCMYFHARAAAEGRDVIVADLATELVRTSAALADTRAEAAGARADAAAARAASAQTSAAVAQANVNLEEMADRVLAMADGLAAASAATSARLREASERVMAGARANMAAAAAVEATIKEHGAVLDKQLG